MSEREPMRTCVGCGASEPQRALVRFVAVGAELVPDRERRRGGRGAYLHRRPTCWMAFERRKGPVRSLRASPARAARERLVAILSASPAEVEG